MNISEKLKAERKARKLSQQEFADAAGISYGTYRRYESGERIPPFDIVRQIAKAHDIPPQDFFDELPDAEANDYIAELAVKAQTSPALQKIIKLLNTLSAKQLLQVVLFLEALTDDPEN